MPEPTSDLNAAIATALGILKRFKCPNCGGTYGGAADGTKPEGLWECHRGTLDCWWCGPWSAVAPPPFDTDWAAFGELVEALKRKGLAVVMRCPDGIGSNCHVASIFGPHAELLARLVRGDLRLAVRDAAARALGLAAGGEGTKP